jgi:glutamate 5-kinase
MGAHGQDVHVAPSKVAKLGVCGLMAEPRGPLTLIKAPRIRHQAAARAIPLQAAEKRRHPRSEGGRDSSMRRLSDFRRIVVKVGSALLVERGTGAIKTAWLDTLIDDVAALSAQGREVIIVSSGAIALGRGVLGLPKGALKLEESQAAASVGQIALSRAYSERLGTRGLTAAQVLLTLEDTEARRRYLNARATMQTLIARRAIPIVNENDTVATTEIRYGDNDRLAARVATMIGADCLVLLSDIDGLYTAPPNEDPNATLIPHVERITPAIMAMAGGAGSELSRGGMKTKIDAARIATEGGCAMVISLGKRTHPLAAISAGEPSTWFDPVTNPTAAKKTWISGSLDVRGTLTVDAGAVRALRSGKSLLPAGVTAVTGRFARGDAVVILDPGGVQIGRGLVAYDVQDAERLIGRKTGDIAEILGYHGRAEMIHRDDMALDGAQGDG